MSFVSIGQVAARVMSEADRQRKLAMIDRLTADELCGWVWARSVDGRAPFDGERAALARRARELGVEV